MLDQADVASKAAEGGGSDTRTVVGIRDLQTVGATFAASHGERVRASRPQLRGSRAIPT